ncbi:Nucleotide-binding universal stress protein, UspA family [Desulfacinum infernum DSM 9756]|uniref:Nucleotide-binding universal stress protein, UspA family n=1 Tax=Desulfacinum infernum DSM 9756 TaxID=1121391 RepID=A0A1M4TF86_9BACT|nr:universal stress protein [Desulfacinum infernum]MBC7359069.1 universal stress protein [Desulfacinum sp.]SHE43150.1 Nucleotide-binding universal stress protein, UspA family [Desulfacinum infernum DSM 9756]
MKVSKILWPTDLSKSSAAALDYVLDLSAKYGAEVVLLYVVEDMSGHEPWYGEWGRKHLEEFHKWIVREATERLDRICRERLQGCPRFERLVEGGDPAKKILETVENKGIDLVVLTSHGLKGHFPFGSVAERVVKNAKVPVLVVRPSSGGDGS